jgi:hypothetical protein
MIFLISGKAIAQGKARIELIKVKSNDSRSTSTKYESKTVEKLVSGIVNDDVGPLSDVIISVKGTNLTTQTNFEGKYNITAKEGDILIFSYNGMNDVTKTVNASNILNVIMMANYSGTMEENITRTGGIKRKKQR